MLLVIIIIYYYIFLFFRDSDGLRPLEVAIREGSMFVQFGNILAFHNYNHVQTYQNLLFESLETVLWLWLKVISGE